MLTSDRDHALSLCLSVRKWFARVRSLLTYHSQRASLPDVNRMEMFQAPGSDGQSVEGRTRPVGTGSRCRKPFLPNGFWMGDGQAR